MPDSRVGLRLRPNKPARPRKPLPELPERWREVLAAIVAQRADEIGLSVPGEDIDVPGSAVSTLTDLVTAPSAWVTFTGQGDPERERVLVELIAAGLIEPWDLPDGSRVYTLTPYGAARLHVEIAERGPDDEPHWHGMGCPRRPVRLPRREGEVSFLDGVQFEAPRQGPIEELMMDADDEDRPVRLFAGPHGSDSGGGYTVPIDRRLGGKARGRKGREKRDRVNRSKSGAKTIRSGHPRGERSAVLA